MSTTTTSLLDAVTLPCAVTLSSRIMKSAMSDSLGDGTGHPSNVQNRVYQRWAQGGGVAAMIIGEVQITPNYCEKPGNLVLNENSDLSKFRQLAATVQNTNSQLWLQLGHAGALAYLPTAYQKIPKGPSALDLPELKCEEISLEEIHEFSKQMAVTAKLAKDAGFGGIQIHAAHGFLVSQFLSPLFNLRKDDYGCQSIENRSRLLLEAIDQVRTAVGPNFPIAVKLNSSDQLQGGLTEEDSLQVIQLLDRQTTIDIIDISGGTYFPGAKAASDGSTSKGGPYFLEYAKKAKSLLTTNKCIMCTGGFKTKQQGEEAIRSGSIDLVGLARALVLEPNLPQLWKTSEVNPTFPRFTISPPKGGITDWYTMRITEIGQDQEQVIDKSNTTDDHLLKAVEIYRKRDEERAMIWNKHFFG